MQCLISGGELYLEKLLQKYRMGQEIQAVKGYCGLSKQYYNKLELSFKLG